MLDPLSDGLAYSYLVTQSVHTASAMEADIPFKCTCNTCKTAVWVSWPECKQRNLNARGGGTPREVKPNSNADNAIYNRRPRAKKTAENRKRKLRAKARKKANAGF
jgi:hypothetical protein